jgi:hypothetical protein
MGSLWRLASGQTTAPSPSTIEDAAVHWMVAQQQADIKALTTNLKEQASQIRKVTRLRRVELSKPAPQMVADNQ